jgi:hypothetical protein
LPPPLLLLLVLLPQCHHGLTPALMLCTLLQSSPASANLAYYGRTIVQLSQLLLLLLLLWLPA